MRGIKRNTGQIQNGQDVGVIQLVKQAEPDDIKAIQGLAGFQGKQRQSRGPQAGLHVDSGCENPLGRNVRMGVENMIQNLHPEMGGADLIKVRKGQRNPQPDPFRVLYNLINFAPQIAAGFFNQG